MSTFTFTEWPDAEPPGVDAIPSEYLLTFWTPVLGPSCVLLLRAVGAVVARQSKWSVTDEDLGATVGLRGIGNDSPLRRSVRRLEQFGFVQRIPSTGDDHAFAVRLSAPELPARNMNRLPGFLKLAHGLWREARAS